MKKIILTAISTILFCGISYAEETATMTPAVNVPNVAAPAPKSREEKRALIIKMHQELKAKREAMYVKVKAACAADIATAGCEAKEKAQLMQCIRLHRQKDNNFKLSPACSEAMAERKAQRAELKREKQNNIKK